jgi:hypothetical protein
MKTPDPIESEISERFKNHTNGAGWMMWCARFGFGTITDHSASACNLSQICTDSNI